MHRFFVLSLACLVGTLLLFAPAAEALADTVIYRPAQSPPPPPQRTVVVQSGSPTVVVVERGASPPSESRQPAPEPSERERKVGLHFDFGGTVGPQLSLGGFSGALRLRPAKFVAIDLGAGYYAGRDYDGDFRTEVPISGNVLFFLNPKNRVQFYVLLGTGVTLGTKETGLEVRDLIHVGGQGGLGIEFRIAKGFALNADFRGVLRYRVDGDPRPEFVDGSRSSDLSGGAIATFGATFYF